MVDFRSGQGKWQAALDLQGLLSHFQVLRLELCAAGDPTCTLLTWLGSWLVWSCCTCCIKSKCSSALFLFLPDLKKKVQRFF